MNLLIRQFSILAWALLRPNRNLILFIISILLLLFLANILAIYSFNADGQGQGLLDALNELFSGTAVIFVFHLSAYTEFNSKSDHKGFPRRLFTLPVPTFLLFLVPTILGLLSIQLVFWLCQFFGRSQIFVTNPIWAAFKLAVFMNSYQLVLWRLESFGSARMVIIGMLGLGFVYLEYTRASFLFLVIWALLAIIWTAKTIKQQRSGGGALRIEVADLLDRLVDVFPSWTSHFSSKISAQMWFEWRRAGYILPFSVGTAIIFVILPLSILTRENADVAPIILGILLALPPILAVPIGKGFSKSDLWSEDMELSSFLAVRPLSNLDIIIVKLKVAAISTALSWLIVLLFLFSWLPLWANLDYLLLIGNLFWEIQNHSLGLQFAVAVLTVAVGALLTWKFMVSGLWIGLSKHRMLFVFSFFPLIFFLFIGVYSLVELANWILEDYTILHAFVWIAGVLVILKFVIAAWSWRSASVAHVYSYLSVWIVGTGFVLTLAILLWSVFRYLIGVDSILLQSLFLFAAMLVMPLAQIGLAPQFLAKNRHR